MEDDGKAERDEEGCAPLTRHVLASFLCCR